MDQAAWLGLAIGLVIGGIYGALQAWEMARRRRAGQARFSLIGPTVRILFLLAALWLVSRHLTVNRYWLVGALAVAYIGPVLWQLRRPRPKQNG